MGHEVFDCQRCGRCCEGRGGIVLGPKDRVRLARWLNLPLEEMIAKYCEIVRGKLVLGVGSDNFCIFFQSGRGCSVHEAKPDICRAWPFFRGNLEDGASFAMAREFCPGIDRNVKHAEFRRQGLQYLQNNNLLARNAEREANSLIYAKS